MRTSSETEAVELVVWVGGEPAGVAAASESLVDALLVARDTQARLEETHGTFVAVTRSNVDGHSMAVLGGVSGLVKTLAIEAPEVFCRVLELPMQLDDQRCAGLVLAELADSQRSLAHVGYDADEKRWTMGLIDTPSRIGTAPGPQDLFVVTGGGRGITAACAKGLAEKYGCGLILLGRTPLREQPEWAREVPLKNLKAAIAKHLTAPTPREVDKIYRELAASREITEILQGTKAEYIAVDITDPEAVAKALAPYRITGLVHGAGVLADKVIKNKQADDVRRVLKPKLEGLSAVLQAVDVRQLRHIVLFSSVAGFFGNHGQADYAMANEALNRMAAVLKRQYLDAQVTSINWGAWDGGMVTPQLAKMFTERGVPLISVPEGVRHFLDLFESPQEVVTVVGPATPLSARPPRSSGTLVLHRDPLPAHPYLKDHTIGGQPVLPVTVAIGAILNAVGRVRPELTTLTDFAVLKGLVGKPGPLKLRLVERHDGLAVLVMDDTGRPRYQALMEHQGPQPEPMILPEPTENVTAYADGTLFHGPSLQGIAKMTSDRKIFECDLCTTPLADGAYATDTYDPFKADLLLQAALVWVRHQRGVASLPVAVGTVECHKPLPQGPFRVLVEQTGEVESRVMCTVTACAPNGEVLLRFRGVDLVCSQALKFAVGA
ncbi:SDR family NAD(P)-dependent oxidoreductase [Actinocrispum sp. NPDC049592]|uniref:SDR family NAD(P)-dependent oxidoreductase n=1 Tax=Actinocrispum sp. NPDC049592 TaxID=3154835 RepID=UPI003424EF4D